MYTVNDSSVKKRKYARQATGLPIRFSFDDMVGEHHHKMKDASEGGVTVHPPTKKTLDRFFEVKNSFF